MLASTETVAALQAFRKRHGDAQRVHGQLAAQPSTVDLAYYRSVLKNKAIVDEAEKIIKDFKPVTYDVSGHLKAIEAFEVKAVSSVPPTHVYGKGLRDRSRVYRSQRQRRPPARSMRS